jgi:hypothetical protein
VHDYCFGWELLTVGLARIVAKSPATGFRWLETGMWGMVLDVGVKTGDSLRISLTTAIERALTLKTWVSRPREQVTSEPFIRRHTEFDSVEAFYAACPCDDDTVGGVQQLPPDERDGFVARTTDFETWDAMKESAAIEDLVTLQNV